MDQQECFLIVGLGNPGKKYDKTRHNTGFCVVEALAKKHSLSFKPEPSFPGRFAQGRWKGLAENQRVLLLLPTSFINLSGEAVRRCVDYYHVSLDHLMVVSDEAALPLGRVRIRSRGSSGGHNGLKSVEAALKTSHYARLRVGIGAAEGQEELADHVLSRFSERERAVLEKGIAKAVEGLELWLTAGIAEAMQSANVYLKENLEEEKQNG